MPRLSALVLLAFAALAGAGCPGDAGGGSSCVRLPGCEPSLDICCDAQRVCEERVCQGVGYICSVDAAGKYAWIDRAAPCDDADPCTVDDLCVGGRCQGLPMTCDSPPPNVCLDGKTLESYTAPGVCKAGLCDYGKTQLTCAQECEGDKCTGEPCKGVTCNSPPSACYETPGTCSEGQCAYKQLAEGSACTGEDPCLLDAKCDAQGSCQGTQKDCAAPNTKGATCVPGTGECQGYTCESGFRDCNDDMRKDGCETSVSSNPDHCGDCNKTCKDAAHMQATCTNGSCKRTCDSGWGNCDGDVANGCERRLGRATCDESGTNTSSGCGTAYCGKGTSKTGLTVVNFGKWYCAFCTHCKKRAPSSYSWCLFGSNGPGQYSTSTCSTCCNDASADLTCGP